MRVPKILSFTRLAIFLPVALISLFASPVKAAANEIVNPTFSSAGGGWAGASGGASCSGGNPSLGSWQSNALNFSYVWNVVTQTVVISQPSAVQFSYTVQDRTENWINGRYSVLISDGDQSVTSGIVIAPNEQTTLTLSLTTTQPNEVVTIAIGGDDNGLFWAGCYGPIFTNAQISVAQVSRTWIELNEGGSGTLSANGGTFTSVIFASYGTPNGSSGEYTQGSCHAQSSTSVIESLLIGNSSATVVASNGIFGDPCGGSYKRLYVLAEYVSGTSPTTTTTIAPYLNPPQNLTATAKPDGSVDIDWDEPTSSNVDIYAYGVMFYELDEIGGTTSGSWGAWTNQGTNYSLTENMFVGTTGFGPVRLGIKAGNESCFSAEGVGPCVYGPEVNVDVIVIDPTPPTTTTSTTTTTTIPETTIPETTIPEPEVTSTTEAIIEDVTTTTEQEVATATTIEAEPELQQEESDIDEEINDPSPETTVFEPDAIQEDAEEEAAPPIVVEPTSSDELVNDILSGEATDEQVDAFLEDVFSDGVTEEAIEDVVDIINTGTLNPEQVQEIIDEILAEEINSDQAVQLATSPELLASITSEQAEEIFASIDTGDLSDEEASQVVAAVQNAVESVRKAFETEINIFEGKFDTYVPTGSRVTVAERRVVVAAGAVLFMAPVVLTSSTNTTTSNSAPNRKQ